MSASNYGSYSSRFRDRDSASPTLDRQSQLRPTASTTSTTSTSRARARRADLPELSTSSASSMSGNLPDAAETYGSIRRSLRPTSPTKNLSSTFPAGSAAATTASIPPRGESPTKFLDSSLLGHTPSLSSSSAHRRTTSKINSDDSWKSRTNENISPTRSPTRTAYGKPPVLRDLPESATNSPTTTESPIFPKAQLDYSASLRAAKDAAKDADEAWLRRNRRARDSAGSTASSHTDPIRTGLANRPPSPTKNVDFKFPPTSANDSQPSAQNRIDALTASLKKTELDGIRGRSGSQRSNRELPLHVRSQTVDLSRLPSTPNIASSIIRPGSPSKALQSPPFSPDPNQHAHQITSPRHEHSLSQPSLPTTLTAPDLQKFQKSSVKHLRTLSKIADSRDRDLLSMPSVATLQHHRQLRSGNTMRLESRESSPTKREGITAWTANKLMDKQRQFLQAYEYLCHIGEAKEWIEDVIRKPIPAIVQLEEALRDGVTLAEIVQVFYPDHTFKIFRNPKLQYRHTDNIALFFQFLDEVELPDVFRFEMIDLYEKKNIPKVIYCIHALSWLLYKNGVVEFRIGNLVGQLEFQHEELEQMQKGLDKSGVSMPSFSGVGASFGAEPEETEQEKIDRQLHEAEDMITDFEAQVRGALERLRLSELMEALWENEAMITELQSIIRGQRAREELAIAMHDIAAALQPVSRGFLVRKQAPQMTSLRQSLEPQVCLLQNLIRGHKARTQVQHMRLRTKSQEKSIAKLQAAIRGAFVRGEVMDQYEETQAAGQDVVQLQAMMRAALVRKKVAAEIAELRTVEPQVCMLQAALKGALQRRTAAAQQTSMLRAEAHVRSLQAALKGFMVRKAVREQYAQIQDTAKKGKRPEQLQAAVKGYLIRRAQQEQMAELAGNVSIIQKFQSLARGKLLREKLESQRAASMDSEEQIVQLQALSRAMAVRRELDDTSRALKKQVPSILNLQSFIRGGITRSLLKTQAALLAEFNDNWTRLQSIMRGYLNTAAIAADNEKLISCNGLWTTLQSVARGNAVRDKTQETRSELQEQEPSIISLQSSIRGALLRDWVDDTLSALDENQDSILQFQAIARGRLCRQKIGEDHLDLLAEEEQITKFQALGRGALQRVILVDLFEQLDACLPKIEELQSLARGRNLRLNIGNDLMELEAEEDYITELQSYMRGHKVRAEFAAKEKHYRENMEKVVKVQSLFRAKVQGEAYRSLTSGKNPPVGTVKGFVHLLNDSDFDFDEEIEFERLRKTVVKQIRQNEVADEHINELDTKIALLVQNKITLDEVIKRQKHFGGHVGTLINNSDKDPFDLKAINKSSKRRLEQFQELFFLLQTQPQYIARLFIRLQQQGISEKDAEGIKHATMRLFGYAQKRREEYHLIRLLVRSATEEIKVAPSLTVYERQGQSIWNKVFSVYRTAPKDRRFIYDVLGELVKRYILDAHLDLESSPLRIYRSLINEEELRTGKRSRRDPNVSEQQAAQDPETKAVFVRNLQDLRDIADHFIVSLDERLHQMPFSVRYIARQIYEALIKKFPHEDKGLLLKTTGRWIWRSYFRPAVLEPEKHGAADRGLTQEQKHNLGIIARVIGHVASATEFGGETRYLAPLNPWLANSAQHLASIWGRVIQVQDAETYFDIDEFNDLYAKHKPTLYIKMSDISFINRIVCSNVNAICPDPNDVLRGLVHELENEKHEAELMRYSSTEIYLTLTPKLHKIDDFEADTRTLMMETKRCILYIIRVQTGANLLEIMLKQPTMEDEKKWRALVHDELSVHSRKRGAYADSGAALSDIGRLSYQELKATALEHILLLEQKGKVTRTNNYQDILNAIAIDIRTKHRRRLQRQKELESAKLTLRRLDEQAAYLKSQMKTYDTYIEQAMMTLQNKKGKKRFLMPFTKQWDHQRELAKLGREVKFGSYKYSARNLANRGVLVYWKGFSERDWDRVDLTISSNEVGVFMLEGTSGNMVVPKASAQLPLDDLLQAQYNNNQFMDLFDGQLRVNVNLFLHLIMKKFYN